MYCEVCLELPAKHLAQLVHWIKKGIKYTEYSQAVVPSFAIMTSQLFVSTLRD